MIVPISSDFFSVECRPNAHACCALLRSYAKGRELKKALLLFETMEPQYGVKPDKYAFLAVFWACWTCGKWQQAAAYIVKMEAAGYVPDNVIYTTLINMYEANGQIEEAMETLERMENQ